MSTLSPEELADCASASLVADSRLHAGLIGIMLSIGSAIDVCSYGLVIGDSYVPFDPDEDECQDDEGDDATCEQVWVRVAQVTPTGGVDTFRGMCGQEMQLALEVGVLRCIETPEQGEAPRASDMLAAVLQSMDDMNAIYRGAMGVDDDLFDEIIAGEWTPVGPMGGQYGGIWTFTVTI